MCQQKMKKLTLTIIAIVFSITIYFIPILTFDGEYIHSQSGSIYKFENGRFFENDHFEGVYETKGKLIRIGLNKKGAPIVDGHIGWNQVTLPLPKYGKSIIIKK